MRDRMLHAVCSSEQSSFQHEGAPPTYGGDDLECHSLVAPDECIPLCDHSSEKILIFRHVKSRIEGLLETLENKLPEEHIACAPLPPVNHEPCRVGGAFVEFAPYNPLWRIFFEVWLYGS